MDLNIDNYDLEDILKLFKIPLNFGESHLKQAKKIVLKTHPDKSGLSPDYFRFYSKAYKILYSIYTFKNKSDKTTEEFMEYNIIKDDTIIESQHKILDMFFEKNKRIKEKPSEFNSWFNAEFEKNKLQDNADESGYGDWLKTDEGIYHTENTSLANMNNDFEKHKNQVKSLVVYSGINDLYSSGMGGSLLGENDADFSSNMFSNLTYQDIKQAHTETIIPVTMEDFDNIKKFNNVEDYKKYRDTQNVNPLSSKESHAQLENDTKTQNIEANKRAYFYAKQLEESKQKSNEFWGKLQRITNR